MRKRTKLRKKVNTNPSISSKIMSIEQSICESHSKENFYDETLAVTRIKSDPNFFFRYAKKFSICTQAIGPLLHPVTHLLTDNKTEMCTILLNQFNSVFSTPKPDMIISDPVSYFSCQSIYIGAEINYPFDIDFSESIIVESIKELSSNSAAGHDGFPSSLLINCSDILAPALKLMFSQSLTQCIFPSALKRAVIVSNFKSGDKCIPGNYRPISLTSCISIVFECIIRKQVLAFLERKGLLNNTQHGFTNGR